mgnify:CR=1 FL=1
MTNMYIGPSIRGVVKHGAAFSGGLPARGKKMGGVIFEILTISQPRDRCCLIVKYKRLVYGIIRIRRPVSDLADAIKRSNEEGTAVAVAYDRISELTRKRQMWHTLTGIMCNF